MTLDEAILLLKKTVKFSDVKNQKHIDLTLIPAAERQLYDKAMIILEKGLKASEISDSELKAKLGLN